MPALPSPLAAGWLPAAGLDPLPCGVPAAGAAGVAGLASELMPLLCASASSSPEPQAIRDAEPQAITEAAPSNCHDARELDGSLLNILGLLAARSGEHADGATILALQRAVERPNRVARRARQSCR